MKKFFLFVITALLSAAALAIEPVPMVDVEIQPDAWKTRTEVPSDFTDAVLKAYHKALNDEVQNIKRDKLDILAVGPRAKVVITDYYDPNDFTTKSRNESDRRLAVGPGVNPNAPRFKDTWEREYGAHPDRAKVTGYVEFDGRRMPFEETVQGSGPAAWLAADIGRNAFRTVLGM